MRSRSFVCTKCKSSISRNSSDKTVYDYLMKGHPIHCKCGEEMTVVNKVPAKKDKKGWNEIIEKEEWWKQYKMRENK